jgi:hypothetical protein
MHTATSGVAEITIGDEGLESGEAGALCDGSSCFSTKSLPKIAIGNEDLEIDGGGL